MMRTRTRTSVATIVVIGPSPAECGGMASVVQQMCTLDFGTRCRTEMFPTTVSPSARESFFARAARHIHHLRQLQETIHRSNAHIVHIHTCSRFSFFRSAVDMIVTQRLGCRVVLHIHGAAFDEFHAKAGRIGKKLIAWALSRADRVIALSETWRAKLRAMAPKARLTVIENAVAAPPAIPSRASRGSCRFVLLARMDDWKGIDDLLAACADVRAASVAFELRLAGPPGTAGNADVLAQKIKTLGLDGAVCYVGAVRGDEKTSLLHWADVYVQPSHHEGMPISLLEALGFGLPVVATRVGAVPEVITEGREGLLVPPHRPELLAAAMRDLAGDTTRREMMSRAARRQALTRFGLERFRDELMALYSDLLTRPHRTRLPKASLSAGHAVPG